MKPLACKMKLGVVAHKSQKAVPEASQLGLKPCSTQGSPCPSEPQHPGS